jgi:magnesium transporter
VRRITACFSLLGRDPAFGSGPLATVIQDLLSIIIYFAIAVTLAP